LRTSYIENEFTDYAGFMPLWISISWRTNRVPLSKNWQSGAASYSKCLRMLLKKIDRALRVIEMAELILTEEEKALPFWIDLDDAALGRAIKYYGLKFLTPKRPNDESPDAAMDMIMKAATVAMVCRAHEMNTEIWELTLTGVTLKGESVGDWRIVYQRLDAEGRPPQPTLYRGC